MLRLDIEIAVSDEIILNILTCKSELPDMGLRCRPNGFLVLKPKNRLNVVLEITSVVRFPFDRTMNCACTLDS